MLAENEELLEEFRQLDVTVKAPAAVTAPEFLAAAKRRLLEAHQRDSYKQLIVAVSKNSDEAVIDILADYPDLTALFRRLREGTSTSRARSREAPAAKPPAPKAPVAKHPAPKEIRIPPPPRTPTPKASDLEAEVLRPIRERGGDAATQLVSLVFQRRGARASLRVAALRYARTQATPEGSFRKLVILRGPPGCGKSQWALEQLRMETGLLQEEEHPARLMHVCAADDFHTIFKVDDMEVFASEREKIEASYLRNEARAKLAMEVGIQPLYVDGCHAQLWEMAGYVRLAKKSGYEVVFVDPAEISVDWNNLDFLQERNGAEGRPASKVASADELQASLYHFENLPEVGEEAEELVLSCHPGAPRPGHSPPASQPAPAAAALGNGAKRPAPAAESAAACKVARTAALGEVVAMGGLGTESRVASNLLKSLLRKGT